MKRIALFLPSLSGGGAERVFVQLANQFASRGIPTDLVLSAAQGPYLAEVDEKVSIVDLQSGSVSTSMPALVKYLRVARPGVVLSGLTNANIVAVLACRVFARHTASVISIRALPSHAYRHTKSLRMRVLLRLASVVFQWADGVIVNSEGVADDFLSFFGFRPCNMRVVYNPIPIDRIDALSGQPVEHPWFDPAGPPVILSVGRLHVLKDFGTLIRAFGHARREVDCRLVILGEGDESDRLTALARQLGIARDVSFPGFVDNPFSWMRQASVFVSSSLSEGCPNALMQALACGVRVVSTESAGGAAEILDGGRFGDLVPVGDDERLAASIVRAIRAPRTGKGRKRAEEFSESQVAEQYLNVLLSIAEARA